MSIQLALRFDEAPITCETRTEAFFKRKAEVEKELAELQAGLNRAQRKAGEAAVTHQSYVYQLDRASAGYYRELEKAAKAL